FGLVLFLVTSFTLIAAMAMISGGAALLERLEKRRGHEVQVDPKYATYIIALEIIELLCLGGTWMWKRWGIYGYFGANALVLLVSYKATGHWPASDLIALAAMGVSSLPRLHMFE
ncbi:MAG: hypothetical protein ACRELY_07325, partial [Polyangiaceae bacterium]